MRSSRRSVATATADAAVMRQRYRPVSHELYMTATVAPITHIETNHIDYRNDMTLGMQKEETLKLVEIVTTLFFGKWITKSMEGKDPGTPDAAMHRLHMCCTMRANGSFAICGNAEFFSCGMRQSDNG